MRKLAGYGLLLALGLVLVGCVSFEFGGGDTEGVEGPHVLPTEVVRPTVVLGREFDKPARLVLPTGTPVPVEEEELSWEEPSVVDRLDSVRDSEPIEAPVLGVEAFDFVSYGRGSGVWGGLEPGGLTSCEDEFRRMLIRYEGREPFGPEVASDLSAELVELRPDCLDGGWAPEFGLEPVCVQVYLAEKRVPGGLVTNSGSMKRPSVLGTAKDAQGSVLVHFKRMPLSDVHGCWLFTAYDGEWAWFVSGVGSGLDAPMFPGCDEELRAVLGSTAGEGVDAQGVARAIDSIRDGSDGGCHPDGWGLYPQAAGHGACGGRETGWDGKGALVLNWHPDYLSAGGAVCWLYEAGSGEWKELSEGGSG